MHASQVDKKATNAQNQDLATLFTAAKERLEVEAKWKPIDHHRLIASLALLALSFALSLTDSLLIGNGG